MTTNTDLARRLLPNVVDNPYIPWWPNPAQAVALASTATEMLYGGAAGGGKSYMLLMAALEYVQVVGYSALLLRKTYKDLSEPGCLIPVSHECLGKTDAKWNGTDMQWRFPSGAVLSFGYLSNPQDHFRYQGAAFQMIGFDELTQFRETQYRYLFSRARRPEGFAVPIRVWSTSNPGGSGHVWVKGAFMDSPYNEATGERRIYIPAKIKDNPRLDREQYAQQLARLDPITRRQLEDGDWTARHGGSLWRREWFELVDEVPEPNVVCRGWDLAASESDDAKFTAGVKVAKGPETIRIGHEDVGVLYVTHCTAFKATPGKRDQRIVHVAETDGTDVIQRVEQEPGSGGIAQAEAIQGLLPSHYVRIEPATGSKFVRAGPWASRAERGGIKVLRGAWNEAFFDKLEAINPEDPIKEQFLDEMDALAAACEEVDGYEVAPRATSALQAPPDRWEGMLPRERNWEGFR